jgi:hypothetical protein
VEVGPLVRVGTGPEGLIAARDELVETLAGTLVERPANGVRNAVVGAEFGR